MNSYPTQADNSTDDARAFTTHVEAFNQPNEPDVAIQFTTKRAAELNYHTCIDLSQEEAEKLLVQLQEVDE